MRCPNCGVMIKFWTEARIQDTEEVPCPNCPAILKTTDSFKALMILGLIGVSITVGVTAILVVTLQNPYPEGITPDRGIVTFFVTLSILVCILFVVSVIRVKKIKVVRLRPTCQHCGTFMVIEDAEFCPNCGASMETPAWERITITEEQVRTKAAVHPVPKAKLIGRCLVCGLELSSAEDPVWCLHCGNAFHKTHLLKWIHKRKQCPACGRHLDENEFATQPPRAFKQARRKNKSGQDYSS